MSRRIAPPRLPDTEYIGALNGRWDVATLAITAGRLVERERASIRTVRAGFARVWRGAAKRRLTKWLR